MFHFLADIRIRPKLVFLFVATGLVPLIIVGAFGTKLTKDSLLQKSFDQLETVQSVRKAQIEDFFHERFADTQVMADSIRIRDLQSLLNAFDTDKRTEEMETAAREKAHRALVAPYLKGLESHIAAYGYQNLYLIDANHGHVLLSLTGELESGDSLSVGSHKKTGLADAWRAALASNDTVITDFAPYGPRRGAEAAFIAQPVRNDAGEIIGVLALQLSPELITRIVDSRKGMGSTGESYLLGINAQTSEYELRSNLKTMGDGRYVVGYSLSTPLQYWHSARKAGETGGQGTYTDSAGNPVQVAYNKLSVAGLDWYLISKIDEYEVTAPVRAIYWAIGSIAAGLALFISIGSIIFSRTLTRPIIEGVHFAKAISEGDLHSSLALDQKDELGELANALNTMAQDLRNMDWLQSGKEGLDDEMRGEHETDDLARRAISYLTKHLGAQLGAIYLLEDNELKLRSSYAFTDRGGNFNSFALGEGMVGQAALEQKTIVFSNVRPEANTPVPAINFGAGETVPTNFMAVPVIFEEMLLGVILIGSLQTLSPLQRQFVNQNIPNVAIMLNAARSRQVIRELFEQAQRQQEELRVANIELEDQTRALQESEAELQAQQEELRVTNEELEEQTKALRESEAELQAQQEELRVTNEELEERTKALQDQKDAIRTKNAELVKAQEVVRQKARDLEIASKYKSEFLANMSHELRTPLNSILILSQLMANNKDGNLNVRQIDSAKAINSAGSDLLTLINEILDLSKIEAGKVELLVETFPVDALVTDLKRLFNNVAEDKGLDFRISVSGNVPQDITTDSQRLQQVLRNLLTNAFKFTHKGAVTLDIMRPAPTNGDSGSRGIAFIVKDEGIGIAKEKQEAIFQAFQQADGSTSRKYGGTGLGLSISRELVRLLGGTISLHSEEGKGSTFTVILPESYTKAASEDLPEAAVLPETNDVLPDAAKTPSEPLACNPSPETVSGPGLPVPDKKTVPPCESGYLEDDRKDITPASRSLLIIEDNLEFARIMRDFARERGFKCLVAGDGETGLHYADYYKPSAIILDIGLPGIDGWTVMERLKDNPELRHIPVHFMSAADSSLDAMRMGAIGYLTKPVSMEKIEEAFAKLEHVISKPVSKLLLVEDDPIQRRSIQELIGNGDVQTIAVSTGAEAFRELEKGGYDCMILDLGLEDMSGFDLLEQVRQSETSVRVPIIIYTGRDLTREEEKQLNRYAETIIIKGVKSPERLLDESALFLHRVEANLPEEKRRMLKQAHDKEAVLAEKTVLLVDDDMRNVFALSSLLEEKQMNVVIARNGIECLDKLKEGLRPNAVLMDIMMPVMDGYEAMREIRKQRNFAKMPIIALTAKAMKGDRSKCIEAGASDYLAKPVDTEKLLSMLRVWLY
ncbi:response regulator [Desulfovibrio mangrovi]|uniref:response regulator n=1 Tax=Desulfovibrio mangrovi TaxID=2976983 RepID=UPI0022474A06|nr:response regulator [Desulfovibrio mangrovi]UZP66386.1 response regulator [Desulfovibrio mangrovi]